MRVRILYFASFRDAAGRDSELRELRNDTSVGQLWSMLATEIPLFSRFASVPPPAVNREYVGPATVLRDGDEVAFLPPVAGG
jgi:molybdopterin synthase sulfur carrier subunit